MQKVKSTTFILEKIHGIGNGMPGIVGKISGY
jgi:hypothetical protein